MVSAFLFWKTTELDREPTKNLYLSKITIQVTLQKTLFFPDVTSISTCQFNPLHVVPGLGSCPAADKIFSGFTFWSQSFSSGKIGQMGWGINE